MNSQTDPRVQELVELAESEGFRLPYPPDYICWLEDRGRIVDLVSGEVHNAVIATPTPHAQAVAHLLSDAVGEIVI